MGPPTRESEEMYTKIQGKAVDFLNLRVALPGFQVPITNLLHIEWI